MTKKIVSSSELISKMGELVNKPIWKFAHVADGRLFLFAGKKIIEDGNEKGEYTLHINGEWDYSDQSSQISNKPNAGDSKHDYFSRMESFAETFAPRKIKEIDQTRDGKGISIVFAGEAVMHIYSTGNGFISLVKSGVSDSPTAWSINQIEEDQRKMELREF